MNYQYENPAFKVMCTNVLASPKSGNVAANMLRANLLAAKALAAYSGFESTRNVNTPEKIKMVLQSTSANR